jgi:hypothetical protein
MAGEKFSCLINGCARGSIQNRVGTGLITQSEIPVTYQDPLIFDIEE